MTQAVRVELASSPEEWMRPAFIAFQAALYEYYPLAPDHIKSETLVFHVTTFFEPERPLGCEGSEVPTLSETHDVLVSDPVSYIVPKKAAISTAFGSFLLERGLIEMFQVVCMFCAVGLTMIDPRSQKGLGKGGVQIKHSATEVSVGKTVFIALFVYAGMHKMSKGMMWILVWYFDWLAIMVCSLTAEIAMAWEYFENLVEPLTVLVCVRTITESLGRVLLHGCFAMMDAWMISISAKAILLLLYLGTACSLYIKYRWYHEWSTNIDVCFLWSACTSPKVVVLTSLANIVIFGLKLLLPYMIGYPYSVVKCFFMSVPDAPLTSKEMYSFPLKHIMPRQSVLYFKPNCSEFHESCLDPTSASSWRITKFEASDVAPPSREMSEDSGCALPRATPINFDNPFGDTFDIVSGIVSSNPPDDSMSGKLG